MKTTDLDYTGFYVGGGWTFVQDSKAHRQSLALARGCYQRALLSGCESLSGSTLRGAAARWSGQYRRSTANLLSRLAQHGIATDEARGPHNKRVLVIGDAPDATSIEKSLTANLF